MVNSSSSAAIIVFFSKVYLLFVSVLFIPVLVRLLGPTQYGHYAIILSVYGILRIPMRYGTTETARKYISERSDTEWQAGVVSDVAVYAAIIGFATASVFVLAAWTGVASSAFGEEFTSLFYLLGAYTLARQFRIHVVWILMGLKLESRSEPLRIVEKTAFVLATVAFVIAGFGVEGVLAADVLASLLVAVVGSYVIVGEIPLRTILARPSIDVSTRQLLTYSASSVLFFLFLTSLYHVDVLLLQVWVSDDEVGYYRAALAIAEVLWVAPLAVQLVLLQRVSRHWNDDNIDAIQRQATLSTRYVFLFTLLLTIGMATLADEFVPLYLGESFTPATIPLLLLLPGVLGFALARPTLAINQARRSLRPLILATAACSFVNLALNLLLIPRFGLVGAAVATSAGYGSLVGFQALAARKLEYRPFTGLRYRSTVLTAGVTVVVIVPLAAWITSPLLTLLAVPPLGATVYLLAAIATGAVRRRDVERFVELMPTISLDLERWVFLVFNQIPKLYE